MNAISSTSFPPTNPEKPEKRERSSSLPLEFNVETGAFEIRSAPPIDATGRKTFPYNEG